MTNVVSLCKYRENRQELLAQETAVAAALDWFSEDVTGQIDDFKFTLTLDDGTSYSFDVPMDETNKTGDDDE